MQILRPLVAAIDGLGDLVARPPSVEACRPAACPVCGRAAREAGGPLGIVGHGLYWRQVVGVDPGGVEIDVPVRRYLCRRCEQTTSVLPDVLLPRRWYAAGLILEALRLWLVARLSALDVRRRLALPVDDDACWWSWRSLRRWRRELLDRLWSGLARRLGARGPALERETARRRVTRLLREAGETVNATSAGFRAAPVLAALARIGDARM